MQALAGQPSLLGYYACMVHWNKGALRRKFAGQNMVRPLFLLQGFFCSVGILGYGFGVLSSGICGLGESNTLGQPRLLSRLVLKFSMLGSG